MSLVARHLTPLAVSLVAAASTVALGCGSPSPSPRPLGNVDAGARDAQDTSDAPAPDGGDAAPEGGDDAGPDAAGDAAPFQCPLDRTWMTGPTRSWITAVGRFGGITPDELRIAYTSDTGAISVATRADRAQAFGPPTVIPTETNPVADDRVALAPNGVTVVAVAADRGSFVGLGLQGTTWGPIPIAQFANLTAMASDSQAQFYEPVLGADGTSFYFVLVPGGSTPAPPALYRSTWDPQAHAWATGVLLTDAELAATDATHRRRATGESVDGLTLFFFDEITGVERAAWRSSTSAPYSQFVDLPAFPEAAPTANCAKLYFETNRAIVSAE